MDIDAFSEELRRRAAALPPVRLCAAGTALQNARQPHVHTGWELKLAAGEFLLVSPGVVHDISADCPFSIEVTVGSLSSRYGTRYFFLDRPVAPELSEQYPVTELFQLLTRDAADSAARRHLFAATLFSLAELLKHLAEASCNRPRSDIAATVLAYLENHYYRNELSLTELSSCFGVSGQYLNRRFRHAYGCPIHEKLMEIRLQRAAELLRSGTFLVSDVARLTGWRCAFYFGNRFRRRFGESPGAYARSQHA